MSRRRDEKRTKRPQARQRGVVLLYGESENDTKALKELLLGLKPSLATRVHTRREPIVLIKNARPEEVKPRAALIAKAVKAERIRHEVQCVFVHEDCDAPEPAHEAACLKIESSLKAEGCPAHAVVPAWEMEAWFFLWPEAVQSICPSWRLPDDYKGRDVGHIRNAKEELMRRVLPRGLSKHERQKVREYQESDAPSIARKVRERGEVNRPQGKSQSYARFRISVSACEP